MNRFPILALAIGLCLMAAAPARATNCSPYPFTLVNGTPNDANKVMADFNSILACANTLANAPVNSNITQITGLTTPLTLAQGGTGAALAVTPAESGANSDITSLSGLTTPITVAQGGTGSTTGLGLVPTAAVTFFAGSSAPSGYILGDGSAVSRTGATSTLFGVIGTTYGVGDGSTTFNVPDCRGRVLAGMDPSNATGRMTGSTAQGVSAAALGNSGGEQAHTQLLAEIAAHNHTINDPGHSHPVTNTVSNGATGGSAVIVNGTATNTGTATTGITINNAGSSTPFNVVQPTLVLNCLIKE